MDSKIKCQSNFNGQPFEVEIVVDKVENGFNLTFGDVSWGLVLKPRGIDVLRVKNILKLWSNMTPYGAQFDNVTLKDMEFTFNVNNQAIKIFIQDQLAYMVLVDLLDSFKLNEQQTPIVQSQSPMVQQHAQQQVAQQAQYVQQTPVQVPTEQVAQVAQVAQPTPPAQSTQQLTYEQQVALAQQSQPSQVVQQPAIQQVANQQVAQVAQVANGNQELTMPKLPYELPVGQPNPVTIPNQVVRLDQPQQNDQTGGVIETPPFIMNQQH